MLELNLQELIQQDEPNASFHDAKLRKISLDYLTRTAQLECELFVYDIKADTECTTRQGTLMLTDLLFFVAEAPDGQQNYEEAIGITVTSDGSVSKTKFKQPIPKLPSIYDDQNAFVHWFYISEWNAFIFLAARGARFEWE